MYRRALASAEARSPHTSRRHDYHNGSAKARLEKFLAGRLGEEVVKWWFTLHGPLFVQEERKPHEADWADFWIEGSRSVNVKAELPGRRRFQNTLLVTVEEVEKRPCDIYVAVLLHKKEDMFTAGEIMGWASLEQVKAARVVMGYEKDFAIPYAELPELRTLLQTDQRTRVG